MCKDPRGGGGYYVRNGIMLSAEGVGAGRSGHRARAEGPPGGMCFQMPGPGPYAGRAFLCNKKRIDTDAGK